MYRCSVCDEEALRQSFITVHVKFCEINTICLFFTFLMVICILQSDRYRCTFILLSACRESWYPENSHLDNSEISIWTLYLVTFTLQPIKFISSLQWGFLLTGNKWGSKFPLQNSETGLLWSTIRASSLPALELELEPTPRPSCATGRVKKKKPKCQPGDARQNEQPARSERTCSQEPVVNWLFILLSLLDNKRKQHITLLHAVRMEKDCCVRTRGEAHLKLI